MYECVHSHATQGWRVLESASVSYGRATPYFPVIDLLKRYVHIDDTDDACTIRAKVTGQVLTLDEALQDTLPALLALLDALPDDSPFRQLDPPQRRQRTLTAFKRVLLRVLSGELAGLGRFRVLPAAAEKVPDVVTQTLSVFLVLLVDARADRGFESFVPVFGLHACR